MVAIEEATLEACSCQGLQPQAVLQFKRLLGEAIACSLDGDYANARNQIASARQFLDSRKQEVSRYWYLQASGGMAFISTLIGLAIWYWRTPLYALLGERLVMLTMTAVAGSLGAMLSVIVRMGHVQIDCASPRALHFAEGISRIWAGAISGIVAGLAVQSGLILGTLAQGSRALPALMLAGLAAGISERWIPSIISQVVPSGREEPGEEADREEKSTADR